MSQEAEDQSSTKEVVAGGADTLGDRIAPAPASNTNAATEDTSMEVHHAPKPVHSWRELLTEIGVVVIGVCIALGAEQTVEWLHWREQVAQARQVIAAELASSVVSSVTRLRTNACTEHRLDQLTSVLEGAAKTGSLPPVGDIGIPPRAVWPTGAWDSVVASQTATHFPRQQLAQLASTYKFVQRLENFSNREVEAWETLYSMVGPGRRLEPSSEADLRKALSFARYSNRALVSLSIQIIGVIKGLNLPFSREELDGIAAAQRLSSNSHEYVCQPMGPAPAAYGQATRPYVPDAEATMKRIVDFSAAAQ